MSIGDAKKVAERAPDGHYRVDFHMRYVWFSLTGVERGAHPGQPEQGEGGEGSGGDEEPN
jgi:hypothetical protein